RRHTARQQRSTSGRVNDPTSQPPTGLSLRLPLPMDITNNFDHAAAETRWYSHWQASGYFNSTPDERPPYTIVIPPPNVTGVLHMGHALNDTVQDILLRRARMLGYNTCCVPCTDHASIATVAKGVCMLCVMVYDKNTL